MKQISISPSILWWATGIALGLWFLYVIRDVIVLFSIALLIAAAMEPAIRKIHRLGISRGVSASVVFVSFLAIITTLLSFLIPIIIDETREFARALPEYAQEITGSNAFFEDVSNQFLSSLENGGTFGILPQNLFSTTVGVFAFFASFLAVISMAFYLSLREDGVERFLRFILPRKYQDYVVSRAEVIYDKIGHWMLGQFILMFTIFLLYYIVLLIFGVPNALVLAIFGGLLEIVPYFGPILAAVPAVILGFFVSPWISLAVVISYAIIQQIENHILVPQIMRRAVGLNPVVIILVLFIGGQLAGIAGMILAVPFATGIHVFIRDVVDARDEKNV
jgi:predicted PurR-regulated permease PerM